MCLEFYSLRFKRQARMQIKRTSLLFEISNIRIRAETITKADNFIHECLVQEKEAVYYNVYM
jgi:hypothetical protein